MDRKIAWEAVPMKGQLLRPRFCCDVVLGLLRGYSGALGC